MTQTINNSLETIEIQPNAQTQAAVIWLHGLGADGHDFVDIVPELNLPADHGIRFIFPHAPMQPVTINQGMTMRSWFDIQGIDLQAKQDLEGLKTSEVLIHELIEQQHQQGVAYSNIILAGFSQGGALALFTGLRFSNPLGGIIGLSCYLPVHEQFTQLQPTPPIFLAHGSQDPIVPYSFGQLSYQWLMSQGAQVTWKDYPMEHQVCLAEIKAIGEWISHKIR